MGCLRADEIDAQPYDRPDAPVRGLIFGERQRSGPVTSKVQTHVIPDDVAKFIARSFKPHEQEEALDLLGAATIHDGSPASPRLVRCACVASGGSLDRLRMEIETLKHDYRDVIVEGEYVPVGRKLVRVRDLNEPIPDEA
jgi:hypothetical protein